MKNKVEPFYPVHQTESEHKEADEEFLKVPHTIQKEEQYWACRAGFINGYEIAKKKFEAEKLKAQYAVLSEIESMFRPRAVHSVAKHVYKKMKEILEKLESDGV